MNAKALLLIAYFFSITALLKAENPDWGEADTLASHKLGPGIQYTKIFFKGKKMLIWVTEVDLTNPYNKIEQVQSRHQVPDLSRWTVQEHYKQNSRPGHKVCVAFNHDFFSYEGGICIGINVSEGEIPYGSGWGRSILAINRDKKATVCHPVLDAEIILPDMTSVKIDRFNRAANEFVGECILFNRFNSMQLTDAGKYIKIAPQGSWTVNGADIPCKVLEIADSPLQSSASEYVIFLRGNKLNAMNSIQTGNIIYISQKLNDGKFGTPLQDILNAFHGYPSIAYEGKLHEGEYNDFENGREYEISSRLMAGMSQDGNKLYIVTTEMSKTSAGVNCIDLANYMLSIGAWNVVNFDSGGSVAIVVDEEMLNYPARDAIRPVMDAMLAVSIAPESTDTATYSFLTPSIKPAAASTTQLTLLAFNQYDEVLSSDLKGFTFKCIPEALGYVDEEQRFHAGIQSLSGKIIAEKNGKQTALSVFVRPVENITINPSQILIDKRSFPITVETIVDNTVFQISPDMLSWEVNDSTVCQVENGILKGLSNGETIVSGTFGNLTESLTVKVEIGKGKQTVESFANMTEFSIKSVGVSNLVFNPTDNGNGTEMEFDFIAGRAPFLELTKDLTFYGIPDSLSWHYYNQDNIIKEHLFYFVDIKGNAITKRTVSQQTGQQTAIIPLSTDNKPWDVSCFPVKLKKIKLNFNSVDLKRYNIPVSSLYAYYPEKDDTKTSSLKEYNDISVFVLDYQIYIEFNNTDYIPATIDVYTINGQIVKHLKADNNHSGKVQFNFNTTEIPSGFYILKINIGNDFVSKKIIIH